MSAGQFWESLSSLSLSLCVCVCVCVIANEKVNNKELLFVECVIEDSAGAARSKAPNSFIK